METAQEYLKNLSVEELMSLSKESEGPTYSEDSIVRVLVNKYGLSDDLIMGVIGLRNLILNEITRRYDGRLIP
jgi:hypothetical protein